VVIKDDDMKPAILTNWRVAKLLIGSFIGLIIDRV
jgi:hypothetical protein